MKTHETKAKDLKIKTPQSKKLTTVEKGILLIMVKTLKEEYQQKLEQENIEEMFKQLLTIQMQKYEEIERKLS